MPRISLPSKNSAGRTGLASLWGSEPEQIDSVSARFFALLSVIVTRFRMAPLAALAAVVSLTAVIVLSFLIVILDDNARSALTQGAEKISIRVVPLQPENIAELSKRLAELPEIREARIVTKEEALKEFTAALGRSKGLLEGLEQDNPLPATVELALGNLGPDPQAVVSGLVERLYLQPGVADVVYNASLVSSLGELLQGIKYFGRATIIAVLLIGSLLVGMTIRLGVYAHRTEIEVMQLVGADRNQIQLPFLIEGATVGTCSSLAAAAILWISLRWLESALVGSSVGWLYRAQGVTVPVTIWIAVLATGPLLALLGATLALRMQGQR